MGSQIVDRIKTYPAVPPSPRRAIFGQEGVVALVALRCGDGVEAGFYQARIESYPYFHILNNNRNNVDGEQKVENHKPTTTPILINQSIQKSAQSLGEWIPTLSRSPHPLIKVPITTIICCLKPVRR